MKLFGFEIKKAEQRQNPENPQYPLTSTALLSALGIDSTADIVTERAAIQIASVYACVRVLSESLASLPLQVYRKTDERNAERSTDSPVSQLLGYQPNGYQTPYIYKETGQLQAVLWGNSYAWIQRQRNGGTPVALHPLPAWEVTPELRDGVKTYWWNGQTINDHDMLHIPAIGWDGCKGVSPISLMRVTLSTTKSADTFSNQFYQNGTRLSGVLEHPSKLGEQALSNLKSAWTDAYSGAANAWKVAVLEEGMKFNPFTMPLEDAQFIETRKFQINEIARMFRVPPHMIADLDKATFSNIEHQSIEFVKYTMTPWLVRWEQEINRKLFSTTERQAGYFVKFNLNSLMRGDIKSRYEAYATGRNGGWLSVNDIREKEDMNAVEDGDGYLEPLNMQPLGAEPDEMTETDSDSARFLHLFNDVADRIIRREVERLKTSKDPIKFFSSHREYIDKALRPLLIATRREKRLNASFLDEYVGKAMADFESNILIDDYTENRRAAILELNR